MFDAPSLRARGDVVENQFIRALVAVAFSQTEDVPDDAVVAESDTLDDLAVAHVKAGDEAAGEHLSLAANERRRYRRTAARAMLCR